MIKVTRKNKKRQSPFIKSTQLIQNFEGMRILENEVNKFILINATTSEVIKVAVNPSNYLIVVFLIVDCGLS